MTHKALKILVCLLGILVFGVSPLAAQELLTLNLDNIPAGVVCDQVWMEQDVELSFTATTAEDCDGGGNCSFGAMPGEPIWLFAGRLMIDFGEPYLIYRVEIDVIDWCGVGCTRMFLYDGTGGLVGTDANDTVSAQETLVVDLGAGDMVRSVAVSSCEGNVLGSAIRITSDIVDGENPTWGGIKATFR